MGSTQNSVRKAPHRRSLDDISVRKRLFRALMMSASRDVAAEKAGVSPAALSQRLRRKAHFRHQVELAELRARFRLIRKLQCHKDWRAQAWLLDRAPDGACAPSQPVRTAAEKAQDLAPALQSVSDLS